MRISTVLLAASCALAAPAALPAQEPAPAPQPDTALALRPGLSEADVVQRWGEPLAIRRLNNWTYLFYENGTEAERGYSDCVFLRDGRVVDVIIRASGRMYLGTSSSPEGRTPEFTPPRSATPDSAVAPVGGVRVNPPANPPAPKPE